MTKIIVIYESKYGHTAKYAKWISEELSWPLFSTKKVILFTCGLANPSNPENAAHIRESLVKSLTPEILEQITLFHLQGGIDYSRLNLIHRAMMAMLCKMLLKKDESELNSEDIQLLETYGKRIEFMKHENIQALVEFAAKLGKTPVR